MPSNQCKSSRSSKSKTIRINSPTKLSASHDVDNLFEISGQRFTELPLLQKSASKNSKKFKLPMLNQSISTKTPVFPARIEEIPIPVLAYRNEWRVPTFDKTVKTDSYSQPSYIRSVSASESESWSDDTENEMTIRLLANLNRLDELFYSNSPMTNDHQLLNEIKLWQSRFQHLRVVGKKIRIAPDFIQTEDNLNSTEEEIILKDGDSSTATFSNWAKVSVESASQKSDKILRQQIRKHVINQLSQHFLIAMKNRHCQDMKPSDGSKAQKKKNGVTNPKSGKPLDINENELKLNENLDTLLNVSPISLKTVTRSSKTNFSSSPRKKSEELARKVQNTAGQPVLMEFACNVLTNTIDPLIHRDESYFDCNSSDQKLDQYKDSSLRNQYKDFVSRKKNDKFPKHHELLPPTHSRSGVLPPLKTHGLRPTSAVYNSSTKFCNESRPTSSFLLTAPPLNDEMPPAD